MRSLFGRLGFLLLRAALREMLRELLRPLGFLAVGLAIGYVLGPPLNRFLWRDDESQRGVSERTI